MKNNYILLLMLLFSTAFYAQTNGIAYQAVLSKPNASLPGAPVSTSPMVNTAVCLRFTFLDGTTAVEYQETITTKTDEFGIVNTSIGKGIQSAGYVAAFTAIQWNVNDKTLVVELDEKGTCSSFAEISRQPFSSSPFAFNAITANNVSGIVALTNGGTGAVNANEALLNLGAEASLNKSVDVSLDGNSDEKYPSVKATKTYVDAQTSALGVADGGITTLKLADASVTDVKIASGISKSKVGLDNVDNTTDISKPISNATQAALDAKIGITPAQSEAIVANTDKVGITANQSAAIVINTAKVGITADQAAVIVVNTAKVGITADQSAAIIANTAKVGITANQSAAIVINTAKVGITADQASAIIANTDKVGITADQASAILANTAKIGYTDALVSVNASVAANTAKVGITTDQASAIVANTNSLSEKESLSNKSTDIALDGLSDIKYASVKAIKTYVDLSSGSAAISNDVSSTTVVYPTFVTASSGNLSPKTADTKLTFVPSTGTLSATKFAGDGSLLTGIIRGGVMTLDSSGTIDFNNFGSTALRDGLNDETGTGGVVFANSPTFSGNVSGNGNTSASISGFNAALTTVSANYTLLQSDNGKVINCTSATAVTITVPAGLSVGFNCLIVQYGAGAITLQGSGTTISNKSNFTKTDGIYSIVTLVSPASNVFISSGNMVL